MRGVLHRLFSDTRLYRLPRCAGVLLEWPADRLVCDRSDSNVCRSPSLELRHTSSQQLHGTRFDRRASSPMRIHEVPDVDSPSALRTKGSYSCAEHAREELGLRDVLGDFLLLIRRGGIFRPCWWFDQHDSTMRNGELQACKKRSFVALCVIKLLLHNSMSCKSLVSLFSMQSRTIEPAS